LQSEIGERNLTISGNIIPAEQLKEKIHESIKEITLQICLPEDYLQALTLLEAIMHITKGEICSLLIRDMMQMFALDSCENYIDTFIKSHCNEIGKLRECFGKMQKETKGEGGESDNGNI